MSVPAKKRTSSSKKRRRAHDSLSGTKLVTCKQCGKKTLPHHTCETCGTYKGRKVVEVTPLKKDKKKA